MNEFGRRESHKSLLPAEMPKSSFYTLQNTFKEDNNLSHVSDSYMVKGKLSSCGKTNLKDYEFLKPKFKSQKNVFELDVNDEVYMKDETKEGERMCGVEGNGSFPLEKINPSLSNLDINLFPGSVSNSQSNMDANRFVLNSKRNSKLVDLNEPIQFEESSTQGPVRNVELSVNLREDVKERDIFGSSGSKSQSWSKESYRSCLGEKDGSSVFNTILSESVKNGNRHLTCNYKAGMDILVG